jgi:hypothetical protein
MTSYFDPQHPPPPPLLTLYKNLFHSFAFSFDTILNLTIKIIRGHF